MMETTLSRTIAAAALSLGLAIPASASVILSGDVNIFNPIDGSGGVGVDADNRTFALNILGSAENVLIHAPSNLVESLDESIDALQTLYSSQAGVTSTTLDVSTLLTAGDFTDLDLFVSILPDAYMTAELGLLSSFGAMGGPLFLVGDNAAFFARSNAALNDLLAELGSGMRLGTDTLDNGFQVDGGTVAADPLTAGVGALTYAFTNTVSGGTSLATTRRGFTFIATDAPTPPPIPLPAPILSLSFALAGLLVLRRRA